MLDCSFTKSFIFPKKDRMKSRKEDNDDDEERKEGDFPSSFLSYCPFTASPAVDTLKLGNKDD
jgi:hypothetical protein